MDRNEPPEHGVLAHLLILASSILVVCGACGGMSSSSVGADGGAGAGGLDGSPPLADAPFAYGTATCTVDQFCVHPCCGGGPPECTPAPEAGPCPSGTHIGGNCGPDECEKAPCTPDPPHCLEVSSCGTATGAGPRVKYCRCS